MSSLIRGPDLSYTGNKRKSRIRERGAFKLILQTEALTVCVLRWQMPYLWRFAMIFTTRALQRFPVLMVTYFGSEIGLSSDTLFDIHRKGIPILLFYFKMPYISPISHKSKVALVPVEAETAQQ